MSAVNTIRHMINNIVELDTRLTELRKVTNLTDIEYNSFLERSTNAVKLGSSIKDLISATAEFSRTGFNLTDSEELANVATIYKNVGDNINSIGDASGILISTLKAFNLEASSSLHIIDALNKVGNKYACG